jgi:AAA family ATP:ADP antiporter
MSAYFMLRSVRETMAIISGVQNIPWLFTGTFVLMMMATPVFGWVASRYPRRTFLPWVYYFFIANILIFFAVFTHAQANGLSLVWISRAFFVWLSVFNLFVVSVFWSFMADIYTKQQSRRLFGVISAGGSAGALVGPLVTSVLVIPIGFRNLLPISALLLLLGVYCVYRLRHWVRQRDLADTAPNTVESEQPIGGAAWAGLKFVVNERYYSAIALALLCANFLGGAMYMYLAQMVSTTFDGADRQTQVFAFMDAAINALSFIGQLLIVKHSVKKLGIGWTLSLLPLLSIVGFALLAFNPTFAVIAAFQILRRSLGFGLSKPTSDMLYSVVSPEAKYKAKNFIDTTVYRGWDVVSTWTIRSIGGIGLSGVALLCVPIAFAWVLIVKWIGGEYGRRDDAMNASVSA